MKANWLDKAVAWVDPKAGMQRIRYRAAVETCLAYDGARTGRRQDGWVTGATSANAEVSAGATLIRQRSRDLIRNTALSRNAKFQFASKLVGTGILPRAATGKTALDQRLNELWKQFDEQGNANGMAPLCAQQYLWAGALFESGDVLLRRRPRRLTDGMIVPLQIQTLEIDHLDTSRELADRAAYVIDGIAFDKLGRRLGYYLWETHPGERARVNISLQSSFVSAEKVAHLYSEERPGQVRGVARLASVMSKLKDLDDLHEAKLFARKVEACFAVFVRQTDSENGPMIGESSTASDGKRIESLEPGMVEYLRDNEDVSFAEPKAAPGYPEETKLWQHEIAAGLQIPYELLTGDLSQVNYSSYRGSLLAFKDMIEAERWNTFIPLALTPVWRWFVDSCFVAGLIPEINYGVEWDAPAFDLLDRLEEAKADLAELRSGTMSWPQAVGRKGLDPERQAIEIAAWAKKMDALGIVLDCDPRLRTAQGNIPSGGTNAGTIA